MEKPSQVSELAKYQTQHSSQIKTKSKLLDTMRITKSGTHASRNQNLLIKRDQPLKNPKEQLYTNENFIATVGLGPFLTPAVRGGLYCYDSVTRFVCFEFCFVIASIINRLLFCSAKWNRSIIADYSCMLVVFLLFCVNQFYRKRTE